jgi:hypothetical protein
LSGCFATSRKSRTQEVGRAIDSLNRSWRSLPLTRTKARKENNHRMPDGIDHGFGASDLSYIGCSRHLQSRRLRQLVARSYNVKQKYMQSSQCNTRLSIHVHSLTKIHQPSIPLTGHMSVKLIRNRVSSSGLAAAPPAMQENPP